MTGFPDPRLKINVALFVVLFLVAVGAMHAYTAPFGSLWSLLSLIWASWQRAGLIVGTVILVFALWRGVLRGRRPDRSAATAHVTRWLAARAHSPRLSWLQGVAAALAAIGWAAAPAAYVNTSFDGTIDDPSAYVCRTLHRSHPDGRPLAGVVSQGGGEPRRADECGAFTNGAAFERLDLFLGYPASAAPQVTLALGGVDCTGAESTRASAAAVRFSDAAVDRETWRDRDFLTRDCIVLRDAARPLTHVRVLYALEFDRFAFAHAGEARASVMVTVTTRGSFTRSFEVDLSRFHAQAVR
ncbi:MAG: hypothetical protein AB1635_14365 [Acidobacteriota bacterium]